MRKRCRSRVRSRGKLVLNAYTRQVTYFAYLQDSGKWTEWTFRTISQRNAMNLVAAGEAEEIRRESNGVVQVVGYRALNPTSWEPPSPASLTKATMEAVRREAQGECLTRKQQAQVIKFRVWPLIGDIKAVQVRPRMTDAERVFAEKLLRSAGKTVAKAA